MRSAIFIAASLLATLATGAIAQPVLTAASAEIPAGAAVALPVEIDPDGAEIAVLVVRLDLSSPRVALYGFAAGPAAAGKSVAHHVDEAGMLTIAIYGGPPLTAAGEAARLYLETTPGPAANISLGGAASSASDPQAEALPLAVTPSVLTLQDGVPPHSADTDGNWRIDAGELAATAELFQAGAYSCDNGYVPGPGAQDCTPHTADYAPQDWRISVGELLRVIQLHHLADGRYKADANGEDGFAPGVY